MKNRLIKINNFFADTPRAFKICFLFFGLFLLSMYIIGMILSGNILYRDIFFIIFDIFLIYWGTSKAIEQGET